MKPATGFTTDDGTFFEDAVDAEFYEASQALEDHCIERQVDHTKLSAIITQVPHIIRRYLDAYQALQTRPDSGDTSTDPSLGDDLGGEEASSPVLEQSVGEYEPMPDLGSGVSTTAVPIRRKSNGPRGRRNDA